MQQPLVLFGATWVLYKILFWLHLKSYWYDHLYIKKGKLSTFKQILIDTNLKFNYFLSNYGFFLTLDPLRGIEGNKFIEILNHHENIFHWMYSNLWFNKVQHGFGVKTV